jgi:glycogen(starch) synthase
LALKLSIVIATYNRHSDLKECLTSIFSLKDGAYEVIVIDSGSIDETKQLKNFFPIRYVSIHERDRQRARNIGISIASGDVVAFLDDDVVVCKEWSTHIVEPYLNNSVGGVGGRVVPYGKCDTFYVKTSRGEIGKVFDSGLVIGNFDTPLKNLVQVDSFIGCNMSFRRDLLLRVGGFDENYTGTGYRDDADLCMRIRRLGYDLMYHPKALVWHKFKGKQVKNQWPYWYIRNHIYFYLKNIFPWSKTSLPLFVYYTIFPPKDYVLKSGVRIKFEPLLVSSVFKGFLDGYKTWRKFVRVK